MKSLLSTAPVLLLLLVALLQFVLSTYFGLTSWKGGGFAMFSHSDSPDERIVIAQATERDGKTKRTLKLTTDWLLRANISPGEFLAFPYFFNIKDAAQSLLFRSYVRDRSLLVQNHTRSEFSRVEIIADEPVQSLTVYWPGPEASAEEENSQIDEIHLSVAHPKLNISNGILALSEVARSERRIHHNAQ